MKKIYLYGFAACLGISLMACDGYKEPNPPAQTQPQLPILQATDVTVDNLLATSVYNLPTMVAEGANIELATVACNNLGNGYEIGGDAYISANDFETSFQVEVKSEKIDAQNVWTLAISPEILSNVYHENISWSNDQASFKLRFNVTTVYDSGNGSQVAYVGGSDNFYGTYDLTIIPLVAQMHFYYLYTPGVSNGWNQENSQWLLSEKEEGPFWGFAILDGDYKFSSQPNWDGTNYGAGEEAGMLSTDGGAGNLSVDTKGLYYCDVNIVDLNYSVTFVNTIGIIGSATPAGWDASTALTSDDYLIWTAQVHMVPGEYKLRLNDAWDIDFGGDPSSLTPKGDNIQFTGAEGNYKVTLDLKNIPYSCTIVAQ